MRLISGPGNDHLKQKIEALSADFQNPFIHISHWVKGEVYSLQALQTAYDECMDTPNQKQRAQAQIRDTQDTISKLNQGKFTFGGVFKSTAQKKESVVLKEQLV